MKHYLLSVHIVEGTPPPPEQAMQKMFRDVEAFNTEVQAAGAFVFGGGLHPRTRPPWSESRMARCS
jgi:hypothetical protein